MVCEEVCSEWEIYFGVIQDHKKLDVIKIQGLLLEISSWEFLVKVAVNEEARVREACCLQAVSWLRSLKW